MQRGGDAPVVEGEAHAGDHFAQNAFLPLPRIRARGEGAAGGGRGLAESVGKGLEGGLERVEHFVQKRRRHAGVELVHPVGVWVVGKALK